VGWWDGLGVVGGGAGAGADELPEHPATEITAIMDTTARVTIRRLIARSRQVA
jgi:hypothetical protein